MEKKVWYATDTYTSQPAIHLKFAYQGMELVAELDGAGNILKSFHWGIDKSDTRGGAGGAMGLLMWRNYEGTDASYYPSYDLNGNVTGLLNGSGNYVAWYEYDAFGKIVKEGEPVSGGMKDENPIRFSTQYWDDETGLVYYGFRFYDPTMGRFLNRDPIGEAGGLNLYRFVGNDPANRIDVWGLNTFQYVADLNAGAPDNIEYIYDGEGTAGSHGQILVRDLSTMDASWNLYEDHVFEGPGRIDVEWDSWNFGGGYGGTSDTAEYWIERWINEALSPSQEGHEAGREPLTAHLARRGDWIPDGTLELSGGGSYGAGIIYGGDASLSVTKDGSDWTGSIQMSGMVGVGAALKFKNIKLLGRKVEGGIEIKGPNVNMARAINVSYVNGKFSTNGQIDIANIDWAFNPSVGGTIDLGKNVGGTLSVMMEGNVAFQSYLKVTGGSDFVLVQLVGDIDTIGVWGYSAGVKTPWGVAGSFEPKVFPLSDNGGVDQYDEKVFWEQRFEF